MADLSADVSTSTPPRTRILLVDDQRLTGLVLQRLLASEPDLEVTWCADATEALSRVDEIRPALILQDLVMPGVDGWTMLARYRQMPATAATPVIVLSANDDSATRARAAAEGAADYLVKMPERAALIDCMRRHLAGTRHTFTRPTP